jgi:hypothetical protein
MSDTANTNLDCLAAFGRGSGAPQEMGARVHIRPSPALLAYALRREEPGSLRRLVLERLYRNLTPAERRLCDAERSRTADSS